MAGWIKMPLGREVGISVHVYCGQLAGWIKMARGMEVGLGPCHIELDGDLAPLGMMVGLGPGLGNIV